MNLIHSQHPPAGVSRRLACGVDQFPSGEWITFRPAPSALDAMDSSPVGSQSFSALETEAKIFIQERFTGFSVLLHSPMPLLRNDGTTLKEMTAFAIIQHQTAVRQLLLCLPDLGSDAEPPSIAKQLVPIKQALERIGVGFSNLHDPHHNTIASTDMVWSPLVILFTDSLRVPADDVRRAFEGHASVEVSDAHLRARFKGLPRGRSASVFISYGSPDEAIAGRINDALKARSIRTWFFRDDAKPGDKLHRVMSEGVASHDRILLLCSQHSLGRAGVLNELERVLEREAAQGGASVLIPIRLDDHVFTEWAPDRPDLAVQVRSRVIGDFRRGLDDRVAFETELGKVVAALALTPAHGGGRTP
jgi:hypothetical protein